MPLEETAVVKESSDPAGVGQVINADKEEAHPAEVKTPPHQETVHPTPAQQLAKDNPNNLEPLHNAANMADVYFLGKAWRAMIFDIV